ncbi:hypothetical protein N7481_002579 [Penicillium waksmanii]|uniref:uncharacterized protein n=1 Tax=Penicillium waksmanii TaxID=69791 RepID=UPI00254672C6|nr:uncharacterized protein N7481_002579 [Penicillium waksmanii]KAJ5995602.1 hypothetical protein N7481_002579 [Penicillium waksmanii]
MSSLSNNQPHAWASLPDAVGASFTTLNNTLNHDKQWQAFIDTEAIHDSVTMGVQSTGSDQAILVTVEPGLRTIVSRGSSASADFVLLAQPSHWEKYFSASPQAPYTSFVGIQASDKDGRRIWM